MNKRSCPFLLVLLLIGCGFAGCDTLLNLDDYKPEKGPVVIMITDTTVGNVEADGATFTTIGASISSSAAPNRRTVVFRTSLGFFQGSNRDTIAITADNSFVASAKLSSVNTGTATVTATILGSKTPFGKKIEFITVLPEGISISVDSISIRGNYKSEMILKATLSTKNGGRPTVGHEVTFDVEREGGVTLGDFLDNKKTAPTDAQGVARIRYSPAVITSPTYVTAIATTIVQLKNKSGNDSIRVDKKATTRFYVKI